MKQILIRDEHSRIRNTAKKSNDLLWIWNWTLGGGLPGARGCLHGGGGGQDHEGQAAQAPEALHWPVPAASHQNARIQVNYTGVRVRYVPMIWKGKASVWLFKKKIDFTLPIIKVKYGIDPEPEPEGLEGKPWSRILYVIKDPHGEYQGFGSGSGSVLDPYSIGPVDPDPDPYSESGSGSRRAKWPTKVEKIHVLKCWMASFVSWRLLL